MWLPFNTTNPSEQEAEELQLFREWESSYNRKAELQSPTGYGTFTDRWNEEVARRFKLHVEGDDNVVLIHRKNVELLQEHFDNCEARRRIAHLSTPAQQELYNSTVREALRLSCTNMAEVAAAQTAVPPLYPRGNVPIGRPTPLNESIVNHGVQQMPQIANNHVPFRIQTQPQPTATAVNNNDR